MEKKISGKVYNTETATWVGMWSTENTLDEYGDEVGIDEVVETTLYHKKTGEFFFHFRGGKESRFAKQTGLFEWEEGEEIYPATYEEARVWAEEHLRDEVYEVYFVMEKEGDADLYVTISASSKARLAREASLSYRSYREVLEELIENHLEDV